MKCSCATGIGHRRHGRSSGSLIRVSDFCLGVRITDHGSTFFFYTETEILEEEEMSGSEEDDEEEDHKDTTPRRRKRTKKESSVVPVWHKSQQLAQ